MSSEKQDSEAATSHRITLEILDTILNDFGVSRANGRSTVELRGALPNIEQTKSQHINMSLIGAVPSLANAIVATQIFEARGGDPQTIAIELQRSHNYLDPDIGMTPTINGQEITLDLIAGNPFLFSIYQTADGRHAIPSAVYVDLVYRWSTFLQCSVNQVDVAAAIRTWKAADLEEAAEKAGMPFALVQSEETWNNTEQGQHLSRLPIVPVKKVTSAPPKPLSPNPKRPLEGIKLLCLTHAIAGPSSGRTLAEYGASVLQIMYTHGYEHPFVYTYANLGCASSRLDLNKSSDREHMWELVRDADVWVDSYRGGALSKFGFTDEDLHQANPSLIVSHVRLYGESGPWATKPGFDMQGSASSGMMALCGGGLSTPVWPPGQVINDYTTGYYGALAIQATLLRRMNEGGGYLLSPSLTGTAMSIVKYYKTDNFPDLKHNRTEKLPPRELQGATALGFLKTLQPLPLLSKTPLEYGQLLLSPMGSDLPIFPGSRDSYKIDRVMANLKEDVVRSFTTSVTKKTEDLKRIAAAHHAEEKSRTAHRL
ncbi:hypothetical protein M409DRAFT_16552 [Zasmidium cellare ATCC 36951]|uniref:CoA-transferase family III n=1 Tax=Zasmidium cellare ATCC 36951 TaxID=1080233 RepID=A0A6A6D7X3_ZASCE|nr:uncharacterized protein M409DRAFT_16552 [Zasmidium cellare ATCC 36951]KAF2174289.1 hypothetical protein M409DRAFT_16552 [Zasmidium cellare ATCC 36951]